MRRKLTDALIVAVILIAPIMGFLQACDGGDTVPTTPNDNTNKPPANNHAPAVVLSVVGPEEGSTPLTVKLDASESSDPDNDEIKFDWLFSDGSSETGSVVQHEFITSGKHKVWLSVSDKWGLAAYAEPGEFMGWGLANSPWPKFAHDEGNTGCSPNRGPMMDLDNAEGGNAFPRYWRSGTEDNPVNSVCIGYDDMVVYTQGPWLRARTSDGGELWNIRAESNLTSWPAIAYDGSIIVGTKNGCMHRVSSEGKVIWCRNLSETVDAPVVLNSAINMDHNRNIYIGGFDEFQNGVKGWLFSLDFDGNVNWAKEIESYQLAGNSDSIIPAKLIPAITADGEIIINGKNGSKFDSEGNFKNSFKFFTAPGNPMTHQSLGPPSINKDGYIAFAHPLTPLFFPNGNFYMQMMEPEIFPETGDNAQFGWLRQAPVWTFDGVSIVHTISLFESPYYLSTRTEDGDYYQHEISGTPKILIYGFEPSSAIAGASGDSLGRVYVSCLGLRAFSPISYKTVFPYLPQRYSLWTYTRPSSQMTPPVIGENG
ncbi:MAG: PKD domain-containing protein, partial [bacterium]